MRDFLQNTIDEVTGNQLDAAFLSGMIAMLVFALMLMIAWYMITFAIKAMRGYSDESLIDEDFIAGHAERVLETASEKAAFDPDGELCYFIVTEDLRYVKIGRTNDLRTRINALQVGCPALLTVHATFPGGEATEAYFHLAFATYRKRGEWYRLQGSLLRFVQLLSLGNSWYASNFEYLTSMSIARANHAKERAADLELATEARRNE